MIDPPAHRGDDARRDGIRAMGVGMRIGVDVGVSVGVSRRAGTQRCCDVP